jgi:hypothetical protein
MALFFFMFASEQTIKPEEYAGALTDLLLRVKDTLTDIRLSGCPFTLFMR